MTNKTLSNALIISIFSAFLTGFFEASFLPATLDSLYTLEGLAIFILGIWAAMRLRK